MKNLRTAAGKKKSSWKRELFFPVVMFLVVLVCAGAAGLYFEHASRMQSIDLLRQSARKAVVQCYAIEGSYPESIEYLEENYGLTYNHDKFFVDYELYASNIMPYVDVFERE